MESGSLKSNQEVLLLRREKLPRRWHANNDPRYPKKSSWIARNHQRTSILMKKIFPKWQNNSFVLDCRDLVIKKMSMNLCLNYSLKLMMVCLKICPKRISWRRLMILLVRLMSAMRIWKRILSKNLFSSSNPTNQNPVNNSGPPSFLKRKKTSLRK